MKEDRDLDAVVAEKVTLWTPIPNEDGWQSRDGQIKHWPGPPEYSVNIASAMEVVEKMFADGWAVSMDRNIQDGKPLDFFGWSVSFHGGNPRKGKYAEIENGSLPRAICEAAIAALKP